jgi:hypothetical protein
MKEIRHAWKMQIEDCHNSGLLNGLSVK